MRAILACSALLFTTATLTSCSKTNDINQSSDAGSKIGPGGGKVQLDTDDDGVVDAELRVPGGALTEEVGFQIAVAEPGEYPPQDTTYEFTTPVFAITPHGLDFLSPATVSLLNEAGATTLLRAEEKGTWAPITSQTNGDRLEATVTGLSYFALANTSTGGPQNGASCSGRGPNGSSPTGIISGLSGILPAGGQAADGYPDVDLSTLVDGYAYIDPSQSVHLVFMPYAKACGYYVNGVQKLGVYGVDVQITTVDSVPITTQDYDTGSVHASIAGPSPQQAAGLCGTSASAGAAAGCPGACSSALTVTAIDGTHITGTFNFTNEGETGGPLVATNFDLPFCAPTENLDPPGCCIP